MVEQCMFTKIAQSLASDASHVLNNDKEPPLRCTNNIILFGEQIKECGAYVNVIYLP